MDQINLLRQRCALLGALRAYCLHYIFEAYYGSNKRKGNRIVQEFGEYLEGILIISDVLGLEIQRKDLFEDFKKINKFSTFFIDLILVRDAVGKAIKDAYGKKSHFTYFVAQMLVVIRVLSSLMNSIKLYKKVPKHRQKIVSEEISLAEEYIIESFRYLKRHISLIHDLFGGEFARKISNLTANGKNRKDDLWLEKTYRDTEAIVNSLVPHYDDISERLKISKQLYKELKNCKPGWTNWINYEKICLKILRYLFVPPFKEIKVQARSFSNRELRDAILPNNQHSGFWQLIHDEFGSRHIVCEFKNSDKGGDKQWLNQLRIYLSKPTIGRFGFLFTRKASTKSLEQAQRDAYEQSGILVLIIDDAKIIELLIARAFIGNVDNILERYKADFEIHY